LLPRQRRHEPARALLAGPGTPDRPDAQMRMRRPARCESLAAEAQLLAHDAVADLVHAAAAVGFGVAHAEQAELAPAAEHFAREGLFFFGPRHERCQLFTAHAAHGFAHGLVFGREAEILAHRLLPSSRACPDTARDTTSALSRNSSPSALIGAPPTAVPKSAPRPAMVIVKLSSSFRGTLPMRSIEYPNRGSS